MKRFRFVFGIIGLSLAGCNGWPASSPYAEARIRPEKYPTYSAMPASAVPMFNAGSHRYMVLPAEAHLRNARMASVSANAPVSVFALEGDEPPYSALYARGANGRVYAVAPID